MKELEVGSLYVAMRDFRLNEYSYKDSLIIKDDWLIFLEINSYGQYKNPVSIWLTKQGIRLGNDGGEEFWIGQNYLKKV